MNLFRARQWRGSSDPAREAPADDQLSCRSYDLTVNRSTPEVRRSDASFAISPPEKETDDVTWGVSVSWPRSLHSSTQAASSSGVRRGSTRAFCVVGSTASRGRRLEVRRLYQQVREIWFRHMAQIATDDGSDLPRWVIMTAASIHHGEARAPLFRSHEAAVRGDPPHSYDPVPYGYRIGGLPAFAGRRRCRPPRVTEGTMNQDALPHEAERNEALIVGQKCFDKTAVLIRAAVERPVASTHRPYRFARCR